ncbi:MAG: threonine--tRNA ligase [Candidatus Micrarchaeaceae archaeon]
MRILQLDVNEVEYELVKPEAGFWEKVVYENSSKKITVANALLLLVSIEKGDDKEVAAKAAADAVEFAKKQKIAAIVVYPFAHLSGNLEAPQKAFDVLQELRSAVTGKGIDIVSAPFGWNKKLKIDIKGHPLAEMSRSYNSEKPASRRYEGVAKAPAPDLSVVKKSNWSGLPADDHRTIGEHLDLYSFQEVSPSMVYWHPNGYTIYKELVKFIRKKEEQYGYKEISTPTVANTALWHVSGHIDHYRENMFYFRNGEEELGLKPMNCPSTILVYKSRSWSYKELPFRTAIFDKLYRREVSGALTGLFRVQELTQDDGHIFMAEDQIEGEIGTLLGMIKEVYDTFGMSYVANLSTMPDSHMGDEFLWEKATASLKRALEKNRLEYRIKEKEGAFYGPKIDFDVLDSQGRSWQLGTIQVDYQQPLRFGATYVDSEGKQQTPVMVHRAILGSIERFTAIIVEHYQGKFPTWLAPVQIRIMPISDIAVPYAEMIRDKIAKLGIRVELDYSNKTINYKVRDAQAMKVPYMVVIGQKEIDGKCIAVRTRSGSQAFGVDPEEFARKVASEIENRTSALLYSK